MSLRRVQTSASYGWHALACCGTPVTPMLNHTGELNAAAGARCRCFSSSRNASASPVVDEVAVLAAPAGDGVGDAVDDLAAASSRARACRACPGSTSGRRCWWRSATSRPGTRRRAARRRRRPSRQFVIRASRRSQVDLVVGVDPLGGEVSAGMPMPAGYGASAMGFSSRSETCRTCSSLGTRERRRPGKWDCPGYRRAGGGRTTRCCGRLAPRSPRATRCAGDYTTVITRAVNG